MTTTKQIPFPADLWEQIRAAAQATDRTTAGVVTRAVRHGLSDYLAAEGIEPEPQPEE